MAEISRRHEDPGTGRYGQHRWQGRSDPIRYADAVVVAKDGKIYFTDASRCFGLKEWGGTFNASVLDIVEHAATGSVK